MAVMSRPNAVVEFLGFGKSPPALLHTATINLCRGLEPVGHRGSLESYSLSLDAYANESDGYTVRGGKGRGAFIVAIPIYTRIYTPVNWSGDVRLRICTIRKNRCDIMTNYVP